MENELRKAIEEWVEYRIEQNKELEKKYPPNPPNDVCKTAYMKGLLIENSFEPEVGEMNELFEVEHEKVFVWTHEKDRNSSIIIKVDPEVKYMPFQLIESVKEQYRQMIAQADEDMQQSRD